VLPPRERRLQSVRGFDIVRNTTSSEMIGVQTPKWHAYNSEEKKHSKNNHLAKSPNRQNEL